jgi:hypothetical protein
MYRLHSEWDFGEGNLIFATQKAGLDWLYSNAELQDWAAEAYLDIVIYIATLFADGYLSWEPLQIIE